MFTYMKFPFGMMDFDGLHNNPLFVMSTSSAAVGLPLGIVVTSAESADVIHKGMTTLNDLFPK